MVKDEQDKDGEDMAIIANKKGYKGLSLSSRKLKEIAVKPKVKDGKALLNKKDPSHQDIVDDGEY